MAQRTIGVLFSIFMMWFAASYAAVVHDEFDQEAVGVPVSEQKARHKFVATPEVEEVPPAPNSNSNPDVVEDKSNEQAQSIDDRVNRRKIAKFSGSTQTQTKFTSQKTSTKYTNTQHVEQHQQTHNTVPESDVQSKTESLIHDTEFKQGCQWRYIGCYKYYPMNPLLSVLAENVAAGDLSPKTCAAECKRRKLSFSAVGGNNPSQCFCGSNFAHESILVPSCGRACTGNKLEKCGGWGALSVFKCYAPDTYKISLPVCKKWSDRGCYEHDHIGAVILKGDGGQVWQIREDDTSVYGHRPSRICTEHCSKFGHIRSAYTAQGCYCGAFLEFQPKKSQASCDTMGKESSVNGIVQINFCLDYHQVSLDKPVGVHRGGF